MFYGVVCQQVSDINAREAHTLLQQKPEQYVLVDCRNKEEQQVCAHQWRHPSTIAHVPQPYFPCQSQSQKDPSTCQTNMSV